jgi:hypothetical protein
MTEAEWLACGDPTPMLDYLEVWAEASDRKLRLFSAGCCRRLWQYLDDELGRPAIEASERRADGEILADELRAGGRPMGDVADYHRIAEERGFRVEVVTEAFDAVRRAMGPFDFPHVKGTAIHAAVIAGGQALRNKANELFLYELRFRDIQLKDKDRRTANRAKKAEKVTQATLLRDIFGNPFRPVAVDPVWLTSTVVALAEGTYQDRAFDRLPILADALQDAGCDNDDVLTHCRSDGPHVRGCWVVDLLTGRK